MSPLEVRTGLSAHSGSLHLSPGEVHSWCVSLEVSPGVYAGLQATLTGDERSRSARFRFERDRRRFVVARGALRDLLGRYLGIHPADVRFAYNPSGKPELEPAFGGRIRFNLSHSADLALIGVAADAHIGVDLENVGTRVDRAAIARHFFSAAEVEHLNQLPSHLQAQGFFSCWTKKEAYVKACGEGLEVLLTGASDTGPVREWSLFTVQPAPGYIGAVVVEGSGRRLCQRHWHASAGGEAADPYCAEWA